MKKRNLHDVVRSMLVPTANKDMYVGRRVYGAASSRFAEVCGKVLQASICELQGGTGLKLHVLWPDGKRTYPLVSGTRTRENGDLEILCP